MEFTSEQAGIDLFMANLFIAHAWTVSVEMCCVSIKLPENSIYND